MGNEKNQNNISENGFERFEEFMDNNSFEINVEPINNSFENDAKTEEPIIEEPVQKDKLEAGDKPESSNDRSAKKGFPGFIVFLLIVAGIIALSVGLHMHAKEKAYQKELHDVFMFSNLTEQYERYKEMPSSEQLEFDYRAVLGLTMERKYIYGFDLDEMIVRYLRKSKGGLKPRRKEIAHDMEHVFDNRLIWISWSLQRQDYDAMVGNIFEEKNDTLLEIYDYLYEDEMIDGCILLIANDQYDGDYYWSNMSSDAKEYLKGKGINYKLAVDKYKPEIQKSEELASTNNSTNTSTTSESSSASNDTSSTSTKDLNGWADYDEGYDDVMYNDEYDEERYKTDSEYASGVDDARDEYEEVYGEEFD